MSNLYPKPLVRESGVGEYDAPANKVHPLRHETESGRLQGLGNSVIFWSELLCGTKRGMRRIRGRKINYWEVFSYRSSTGISQRESALTAVTVCSNELEFHRICRSPEPEVLSIIKDHIGAGGYEIEPLPCAITIKTIIPYRENIILSSQSRPSSP